MKKSLLLVVFVLAALTFAVAQQPGAVPGGSAGQGTSPGAQAPSSSQSTGNAGQVPSQSAPAQAGAPGAMASGPITEGCLSGSSPNFTVTDSAGKPYKLNIPANADATPLNSHVGESVQVLGQVNSGNPASIDVNKIGRGNGKCGSGTSTGTATPQK